MQLWGTSHLAGFGGRLWREILIKELYCLMNLMERGESLPDRDFWQVTFANFVCSFVCVRASDALANAADFLPCRESSGDREP